MIFSTHHLLSAALATLVIAASEQEVFHDQSQIGFDPRAYPKRVVQCQAFNRRTDEKKDIDISFVELNLSAPRTLILVHGWPGLWSTWANQIIEFQQDYHLLIPDTRGFGGSTHPGDVESSGTMGDFVGDLACILEDRKVSKAVCIGHDWGSQICWEAARMRPDLFEAAVGVVVPYITSAGPFTPIEQLAVHLKTLTYQVYFQKRTAEAVAELNRDIRRSLRSTYRSIDSPRPKAALMSDTSFLDAWKEYDIIPPSSLLSANEEDYIVEQYSIQQFDNTLQFYTHTNRLQSHAFSHDQGNFTISQPTLSIYPTEDPVANWHVVAGMLQSDKFLANHRTEAVRSAHWPQLEAPETFNRLLWSWLQELPPPTQLLHDKEDL
ncbi:alpha/beta-hydrolase [Sistotremastrum niveocremeum HHB9708]|uniref:Alpha/beta-hydrolase n=1 Tax=Sistotremastrum niveocremeum HHB9708 TaxID=1314777 RepID=A0A164UL78_9AGAM|nr:alpha/beta-hydrolase [Sistotremastrum niveocremeum HHB9708]